MHYLSNLLIILHYKSTLIVYELCGSVVIYQQSPHGQLRGWSLFSLGAGVKSRISYYCYVSSEFKYRFDHCALKVTNSNVQKIKQCFIILLHKRYIEIEKWAYFTVKIIIRNYFACNKILNKKFKLLHYKLSKNLYINQLHVNLLLL